MRQIFIQFSIFFVIIWFIGLWFIFSSKNFIQPNKESLGNDKNKVKILQQRLKEAEKQLSKLEEKNSKNQIIIRSLQ